MSKDAATIVAGGLCTGCGLCVAFSSGSGASMVEDEGYLRPSAADASGIGKALAQVCPGVNIAHGTARKGAYYHPLWGPVLETRLGWSTDRELRRNASSGGALSAVLGHLLQAGEVDYVVQTAVSPHSPVRNAMVESRDAAAVFHAAGSRYAPSAPLQDIARQLEEKGRFAFVGKPCDVAALRNLARVDPRIDEKVPYMFAFMCAGVPSYRGTEEVLRAMGVPDGAELASFRFRGDGWPGNATAVTAAGQVFSMDYNTSWGSILNRHLQFRCKICPDGTGEFADATFADGWHCDARGYPLFEETDGRSLVITRTEKGEALLLAALGAGGLAAEPVDVEAIKAMQPYQARRKGLLPARLAALRLAGRAVPVYVGLALGGNARRAGLIANLRSFLGMFRRVVRAGRP